MTTAVLLAAGESVRLGRPKQLVDWRGTPLVCHTLNQLERAGCDEAVVVIGAHGDRVREVCDKWQASHREVRLKVLENPIWRFGQASSLWVGLDYVNRRRHRTTAVLVAVSDQPLVTWKHYARLIARCRRDDIKVAATEYDLGGGVPACFCRSALIARPMGDTGAKDWIRGLPRQHVSLIDCPEAAFDLDTEGDLSGLEQLAER